MKKLFDRLVEFLVYNGYTVSIKSEQRYSDKWSTRKKEYVPLPKEYNYRFASVTGRGVRAAFCEPHGGDNYTCLDGKISADNEEYFDKWSKCPLKGIELPRNPKQEKKLLKLLKYIGKISKREETSKSIESYIKKNRY